MTTRPEAEHSAGDRLINCAACGALFAWSEREREFYRSRGYSAPKRCRACREARRPRRDTSEERLFRPTATT
jgi:hypothetical protein